jgi:hypothetical protein
VYLENGVRLALLAVGWTAWVLFPEVQDFSHIPGDGNPKFINMFRNYILPI